MKARQPASKHSSTVPGAVTMRGNSPWEALMANSRSLCSVRVGRPVDGPPRCDSTITIGTSVMPARPIASTIRQNPPPEVAVSARAPVNDAPIAIQAAAISSSACLVTTPYSRGSADSHSMMEVAGVIG